MIRVNSGISVGQDPHKCVEMRPYLAEIQGNEKWSRDSLAKYCELDSY